MTLELYNAPISTCSQKVRWVLAEKRLPWIDHRLRFEHGDNLKPDYLKLNPNGVVPTLVHDGQVIIDSSVINEYLDDVFPEQPMRPVDALGRAQMRVWRHYIDEVATPSIRYPSFNSYFVIAFSHLTDEQFRAMAETRPLRRDFYLKMGRTGFPQAEVDAALRRLQETLDRMERSLEQTQWLAHDAFTLADVSIMPTVVRLDDLGLASMWAGLPRVTEWYQRMRRRPAFETTYYPGSRDLGPSC